MLLMLVSLKIQLSVFLFISGIFEALIELAPLLSRHFVEITTCLDVSMIRPVPTLLAKQDFEQSFYSFVGE